MNQKTSTKAEPKEDRKYAFKVRAIERGYYDGTIREEGEAFDNTLDLPTLTDMPAGRRTWFVDAKKTDAE